MLDLPSHLLDYVGRVLTYLHEARALPGTDVWAVARQFDPQLMAVLYMAGVVDKKVFFGTDGQTAWQLTHAGAAEVVILGPIK